MKTKINVSFLIAVAVFFAPRFATAQILEYTNNLSAGYQTFANNLNRGGNTLNEIIPNALDGTEIFKWDPATQNYSYAQFADGLGWVDTNFNSTSLALAPGEGAFIHSPGTQSLVLTGSVKIVGYVNRPGTPGVRFVSGLTPSNSTFADATGYQPIIGDRVLIYDGVFPNFPNIPTSTHIFSNFVWHPTLPLLPPGKSMFVDPALLSSLLSCPGNKTVACGTNWDFDSPTIVGGCCSNATLSVLDTQTNSGACSTTCTRIWQAADCCNNIFYCTQTVSVVDMTPPQFINCPLDKTVPCDTNWSFDMPDAFDACCSSPVTVSVLNTVTNDGPDQTVLLTRTWVAADCCGNIATCSQTVTVSPPPPEMAVVELPYANSFGIPNVTVEWTQRCGLFGFQTAQQLDSDAIWTALDALPLVERTETNQSSGALDLIAAAQIPLSQASGNSSAQTTFFRLSSKPGMEMDFSSRPTGVFTNVEDLIPVFSVSRMDGSPARVVSLNNQNVLGVDSNGIVILTPTNRAVWPNLVGSAPNLHQLSIGVFLDTNSAQPLDLKVYDVLGQLVSTAQVSNVLYSNVNFWSDGWPFERVELFTPCSNCAGAGRIYGVPNTTITIPVPPNCTNLVYYPVGPVPNPWVQPGFTITASNNMGQLESNTYIEAGPSGNGYHVEYMAEIKFPPPHTCCRNVEVQLSRTSEPVDVVAYDSSGTIIRGSTRLTLASGGNPLTLTFPSTSGPVCSILITAPHGQTQILKICCVPTD